MAALREKYDQVAQEKNYKKRCGALSAMGKELKATMSTDAITEFLTSLPEDTYSTLNKLWIARTAGCVSFPKSLLAHPSQTVRFQACTTLSKQDAEETFMSSDSNQQMKSWIIHSCETLPCTAAILEQTDRFFTPQLVWRVLVRTDSEALFKEWVRKTTRLWPNTDGILPCLDSMAAKFPDACMELINSRYFKKQNWAWILPLARARPLPLLRRLFVDENITLSPSDLAHKVVDWAWRHSHDDMIKLCSEMFAKRKRIQPVLNLLTRQKDLVSSHACPTVNRKIDTVVTVFLATPEELKSCETASDYVKFLPDNSGGERAAEVQKVIDAFWKIIGDLNRKTRENVFTSKLFCIFAKKVPPPPAVKQFFRMLQEVEGTSYSESRDARNAKEAADQTIYQFMMSDICRTDDGKYDTLMAEVFERYLSVDRDGAVGYVTMLQVLLAKAKTMDVIQSCFDKLTQRIGNFVEKGIFLEVVKRMKQLDQEVRNSKKKTVKVKLPDPELPLPVDWLDYIPELKAEAAPPYVIYLRGVLTTWGNDRELLKTTVDRFGTALFWDTFEHVLLHAMGSPPSVVRSTKGPDFQALAGLSLVAPVTSGKGGGDATAAAGDKKPSAGGECQRKRKAKSVYFTDLDKKKQDTYGKDADRRLDGYLKLITEASREDEQDMPKALDDLLQFIMQRFTSEQENVQFQVLAQLLEKSSFPDAMWMEDSKNARLQGLWKVWLKARGEGAKSSWQSIGQRLLKQALLEWPAGATEPNEQCMFAVEMCHAGIQPSQKVTGLIDYGGMFVDASRKMEREDPPRSVCPEAVHWMLRVAIPLPKQSTGLLVGDDASRRPLEDLCKLLQKMSQAHKKDVSQRAEYDLWAKWPFVEQIWNAHLESSVSLSGASYLLAGVVQHWARRQDEVHEEAELPNGSKVCHAWWAPIEGTAYESAVDRVLYQIETADIPMLEGAKMVLERIEALEVKEGVTYSGYRSDPCGREARAWTFAEQREWYAEPYVTVRRYQSDENIKRELTLLGKLLERGGTGVRQVQWIIMLVAAGRKGPMIDELLRKVILSLNPRKEGMARCIARQYSYLNDALCYEDTKNMVEKLATRHRKGGKGGGKSVRRPVMVKGKGKGKKGKPMRGMPVFDDSEDDIATHLADLEGSYHRGACDLLSPLMELWLHEKSTRNARIDELMARDDAECYLFFGNTFAEHLSRCRQEHLHSCLVKLQAPNVTTEPTDEGAVAASTNVVQFYHHTMRVPSVARIAQLRQGWRMCRKVHDPTSIDVQCVQTNLWHPETQHQFLQKGLQSTDMAILALIPRLEFVEGVECAGDLLKKHPQPQVGTVEDAGWLIIQPFGSLETEGPWEEVERRFQEAGEPQLRNAIEDREADQLLLALGHADHSDRSLAILGTYAGKFKKAKDALMQAVPNLAPSLARRVIKDVMFKKKAGIALHIAALRLSMDLQVPDPMGLYRVAWREGRCHRDIAAQILVKVATSQTSHWTPEDVRDMFDIFDTSKVKQEPAKAEAVAAPAAPKEKEEATDDAAQAAKFAESIGQAMSAARPENLPYIVQLLLKALQTPVWSLPYLPAVVGKLCLMPGVTHDAVRALMANRNFITETVASFADFLRYAQLALDARVNIAKPCPEFQLLRDLETYAKNPEQIANHLLTLQLKDCDAETLKSFVVELLRLQGISRSSPALGSLLKVWMWLLRADDEPSSWVPVLKEMEDVVRERGRLQDLSVLVDTVAGHIERLATRSRPGLAWLPIARDLFVRILHGLIPPATSEQKEQTEAFKQHQTTAEHIREATIKRWADLVGKGCSEDEAKAFFAECPKQMRAKFALAISTSARGTATTFAPPYPEALATAKFVLNWLMENEPGLALLNYLSAEWPKVLHHDAARVQTLPPLLKFFEKYQKEGKKEIVTFVEGIFTCHGVGRALRVESLRWLGGLYPREALIMWPKLLPEGNVTKPETIQAVASDISELFDLCIKHKLEPPELRVKACSSPEVIALLVKCELPRGRLMAVQALQERDLQEKDKDLTETLNGLRNDPCIIVKAAAQVVWASFFGEKEAKEAAEAKKRQAAAAEQEEDEE